MFRLALKLGKTVAELDEVLTADELLEWQAFYAVEPWGTAVEDHRWETICALFYSAHAAAGTEPPIFFDRDPEENARIRAIYAAERLDGDLERFFNARIEPEA